MVLTWEVAATDADADVAETNWKHKVPPDWGDLIIWGFEMKQFVQIENYM